MKADGYIFEYKTHNYSFESKPYKRLTNCEKGARAYTEGDSDPHITKKLTSFYKRTNGLRSARINMGEEWQQTPQKLIPATFPF